MSDKIRYKCSSVGTDESGTGGLFGSSVFVGVKLRNSILKKIEKLSWFERVIDIRDSKKFEEQECIDLSEKIEKELVEGRDFLVWRVLINTHNDMWQRHKSSDRIKCICHNWIHKQLHEDTTFHVIDNFLGKRVDRYYKAPEKTEIIPIDKFCPQGENKALSISLASIIARGRYLKNFYSLMKKLGIELSDDDNHNLPSTKIEPILEQLKKKGQSREYVFNALCKGDIVQKYNSMLPK